MMQLPQDITVSVSKLSQVFNSTSATYKYYWFLAIIEAIEDGEMKNQRKDEIEKRELFARMVTNSWYTLNYFKISFGTQDKLSHAVTEIKELQKIDLDIQADRLLTQLSNTSDRKLTSILNHFDINVPHKFLSPWLGSGSKTDIYLQSQENNALPPYALYKDRILVQPDWYNYFKNNSGVLKSFCYWKLALFLQARNPNVPDIPQKLMRPEKRSSLAMHKKDYWDLVIRELGPLPCIYTNKKLAIGDYAVEHFLPFQFVAHDLMWNLIPADPSFNSRKGDKLPDFDTYFDAFYELQVEGFNVVRKLNPKNKFVQEFLAIFPDLSLEKHKYEDTIRPMLTIAHNNGFQFLKG